MPQGIESVTLDGVDHRNEILLIVQIVRGVDLVEALVVRDDRRTAASRHLLHVDGEQITIVVGGHLTCGAVGVSLRCQHPVRLSRRRRAWSNPTILLTRGPYKRQHPKGNESTR